VGAIDDRKLLTGVLVVVLIGVLAVVAGRVDAATSLPPLPDRLQLVLAVPEQADATPSLVAAVQHEAELAIGWLEDQTGGTLRGTTIPRVVTVALPDGPLAGTAEQATEAVEAAVGLRQIDPMLLPLIVTTLGVAQAPHTCGMGGPIGVVVFLGNCGTPPSSATTAFGRGVNRTIAHELVHAFGGVAACAPNHAEGHVTDDPADLMTAVSIAGSGTAVLDAAGDDYLSRGTDVCQDIMDSPLWQR
jgi:hypothetical protein